MAGRFGIGGAYIAQPREIFTLQNLLLRRRHLYGITGLSHAALRFYHTGRSKETPRDELHYCSEHLFQPLADSQPNEAANSRTIGRLVLVTNRARRAALEWFLVDDVANRKAEVCVRRKI